ncbi:MAG: AAC(3) family N-acetyltransferase [Planctomycetota bacterium]
MSREAEVIARTGDQPITIDRLVADFRRLGIKPGGVLMVHASLSAIGWVVGGPQAVILALRAAVGEAGTLVMPTHSGEWSDPAPWENPPIPGAWWPAVREHWPAFDPDVTPTREVGVVAETFRAMPSTVRSKHPQVSVAAQGPQAHEIVRDHPLPFGFGAGSPYEKLYEIDAEVLLLGVGYDRCSVLHFAENRVGPPRIPLRRESFPVLIESVARRVEVDDLDHDADRFPDIGLSFENQNGRSVIHGDIGLAPSRLIKDTKQLVNHAILRLGQ